MFDVTFVFAPEMFITLGSAPEWHKSINLANRYIISTVNNTQPGMPAYPVQIPADVLLGVEHQ